MNRKDVAMRLSMTPEAQALNRISDNLTIIENGIAKGNYSLIAERVEELIRLSARLIATGHGNQFSVMMESLKKDILAKLPYAEFSKVKTVIQNTLVSASRDYPNKNILDYCNSAKRSIDATYYKFNTNGRNEKLQYYDVLAKMIYANPKYSQYKHLEVKEMTLIPRVNSGWVIFDVIFITPTGESKASFSVSADGRDEAFVR